MKKKQYKQLLRMIHDVNMKDYKQRLDARITFGLSIAQLITENPELYVAISSDDESSVSDDDRRITYNVRNIQMHESDYLNDSTDDSDPESVHENHDWTDDIYAATDRPILREMHVNEVARKSVIEDCMFLPTEHSAGLPIVHLTSWFPVFVDGVCRFIGKVKAERSKSLYQTVTEAVFQYKDDDRVIITNKSRYKLMGEMDTIYLKNRGMDLEQVPKLTKESWLEDIVTLSDKADFGKKFLTNTSLHGLQHEEVMKFKISHLSRTTKGKILNLRKPESPISDTVEIRTELAAILKLCQNNGDWRINFRRFLKKYGQMANVSEHVIKECHGARKASYGNVDLDNSLDCDDFGLYGTMVNSTINNNMENLYLWTIIRKNGRCCICGIKRTGKKYIEVIPSVIKTVTSDGTCVLTENDQFNLVGPMLKLSIYCSYPETLNSLYLDLFQEHFMHGLPKYWISLAAIIHIICSECKILRRSTVEKVCIRTLSVRIRDYAVSTSKGSINNTHSSKESRDNRESLSVGFELAPDHHGKGRGNPSFGSDNDSVQKKKNQLPPVPTFCGNEVWNVNPSGETVSEKRDHNIVSEVSGVSKRSSVSFVELTPVEPSKRSSSLHHESEIIGQKDERSALSVFHGAEKKNSKSDNRIMHSNEITMIDTPGTSIMSKTRLPTRIGKATKRKAEDSPTISSRPKKAKSAASIWNVEDTVWSMSNSRSPNKATVRPRKESSIDATISIKTHSKSHKIHSYKSLKIKGKILDDSIDLIYNPFCGFPINLAKLPITRSGRMSLPPPDIMTRTEFVRVGNDVHFKSRSTTKMVFTRDP